MKIKKILRDYPMLIIILLLGSYIRLYNIDNLGIYDWDSAYYGNTAKVPILTATWLFNNSNNGFDNEALKDHLLKRGCNSHIVKPGHLFLITISYLIFGINDLAVLMVSALSGIGIILLTFFIAKRMYNENVGYIAAAIIAISGQQVIYSRTGFPQMDTTLIFCIAFYLFWEYVCNNDKRSLIYSSLLCGLTLLFHQSAYMVIFPLLIAIIFYAVRNYDNGLIKGLKHCFYFIAIMSAIFMSAQLLIMFLNSFNPSGGADFLSRNVGRIQSGLFDRWSITIPKLMFYPKMFWKLEGPIITTLIPISVLFVSIKAYTSKTMNYISLALITIIPLIFWNLNYTTVKGIQVVMPFLALCVGVLFTEISTIIIKYFDKKELKTSTTIIFTIFILSFGYQRVFPFVKWESNYKQTSMELIDYMKNHGGIFNTSQNNLRPILSFYIGNEMDNLSPELQKMIFFENVNINTDYVVIDWRQFNIDTKITDYLLNISKNYDPIIKLDYRDDAWPIFNYHRHYDINKIPEIFNKIPEANRIAIYDMRNKKKKL